MADKENNQTPKTTLAFGVTGEFITQFVREQFYLKENGYKQAMETMMSCMGGTDINEAKLKRYAEDVLIGRAEFKGNTADGTFHMAVYEPGEEPEINGSFDIFKMYTKKVQKLNETEKELHKLYRWYTIETEKLSDYALQQVLKETGQIEDYDDESAYESPLLDSYLKRMNDDTKHKTEDYGWLEPNGTFHAVKWGDHQNWAEKYLKEHEPEAVNDEVAMQVNCNVGLIGAGDWLVKRGWVLLHNPAQGIAIATKNPVKDYTKAQREFLYDYYMERDCQKEAYAIWADDGKEEI